MIAKSFIIQDFSSYSDIELLQLLERGEVRALGEIYDRYRQEVYRYALTLVKIPEIAEDLVQDVFVKIWEIRQRLEIKQSFRSYLFRICHNRAIDINKEIASKHHLVDQLVYHYQIATDTELSFTQEELQRYDELVEEALSTLTPQRRKVFDMCKKEKKSYEEVARELGISPNTVKAHVSQTLALLRKYVSQHAGISVILILLHKNF